MLTLSKLKFEVDSSELVQAEQKIQKLKASISDLNKIQEKQSSSSSKADKEAAKTAEAKAKAELAESQAMLAKLKLEKENNKATEEGNRVSAARISILEKETEKYRYMTEGYSKGQATVLAMGKATGMATTELEQLGKVLQSQRVLMGTDPFDKSQGALKSLTNEYKVLRDVQRQYNIDTGLTQKQMEGLTRDKLRLLEIYKQEGKTLMSTRAELRAMSGEYTALARNINDINKSNAAFEASQANVAKSSKYVEDELNRVRFAAANVGSEMGVSTANMMLKFQNALKKSSVDVKDHAKILEEYRRTLVGLRAEQQKDQTAYITRAMGPQITDIVVGLATGQKLMTVMLQQGGQVRDQMALAGIEGSKMGEVLSNSMKQMVPSILNVGKAFVQMGANMASSMVMGAGNATLTMLGLGKAMESGKVAADGMAAAGSRLGTVISGLLTGITALAGIVSGGILIALVATVMETYKVIKAQDDLTRVLALNTGHFSKGTVAVVDMAKEMANSGGSIREYVKVIGMIVKEGKFTEDQIKMIGVAAVEMEKYAGVAVEATIKQFEKLKDKPTEALLEIAKNTGLVKTETLNAVNELENMGKKTDAAALAMKAYGEVTKEQAEIMKRDLSGFAIFMIDLGAKIKGFFSEVFEGLWKSNSVPQLEKQLGKIEERLGKLNAGKGWDPFGAERESLESQKRSIEAQIKGTRDLQKAEEDRIAANLKGAADVAFHNSIETKSLDDLAKKNKELSDFRAKLKDHPATTSEQIANALAYEKKLLSEIEEIEKRRAKKNTDVKTENYFATLMREAENATLKAATAVDFLTASELKLLQVREDSRYAKLNEQQKQKVDGLYKEAAAAERAAAAEELRNTVLEKSEGYGADYIEMLTKLHSLRASGDIGQEEFEKIFQAMQKMTPAAKALAKEMEALAKIDMRQLAAVGEIKIANDQLDLRAKLLTASDVEAKKLTIEFEKQAAIARVQVNLEKELLAIRSDKSIKNETERAARIVKAHEIAADQIEVINRDSAMKYAEGQADEFRRVSGDIANVVGDALTGNAKGAAKRLRDIVVAEFRKPIVMYVQAMIQGFMGQLFGTPGSAAAGGSMGAGGGGLFGGAGGGITDWSGMGSKVAGWLSDKGLTLVQKGFEGVGDGLISLGGTISSVDTWLKGIPGFNGGLGSAFGYLGSITSLFKGEYGSAIGGAIGTYLLPGIGSMIGSFLGGILDKAFGSRGPNHSGGVYSSTGGTRDEQAKAALGKDAWGNTWGDFTKRANEELDTSLKGLVDGFLGAWEGVSKILGKTFKDIDIAAAFSVNPAYQDEGAMGWFKIFDAKTGEILKEFKNRELDSDPKKAWEQFVGEMGNSIVSLMLDSGLPEWADGLLEKIQGKVTAENFTEVINKIAQITLAFEIWGKSMDAFKGISEETQTILIKVSDGFENLAKNLDAFYTNFYSDAEKAATKQAELTSLLKEMGIDLDPKKGAKAKEEFRAVIESLMKSGEEGVKLAAKLLGVADLFADVADYAQQIADQKLDYEIRILRAIGDETGALALEREREYQALLKVDPELAKMAKRLWEIEDQAKATNEMVKKLADERKKAEDNAMKTLEKAISREKELLNERADIAKQTIDTLTSFFELLNSSVKKLYGEIDSTKKMSYVEARNVIRNTAVGVLRGGSVTPSPELTNAVNESVNGLKASDYSTKTEYDRERLRLANELEILSGKTQKQLSVEEKTLAAIEEQIKYLDKTLEYWRQQLEIANGTYIAITSVDDAVRQMLALFTPTEPAPGPVGGGTGGSGGAVWGPGGGAQLGGGGSNGSGFDNVVFDPVAGTITYGDGSVWNLTPDEIYWQNLIREKDASEIFPSYDVGTNRVMGDQIANIHDGELIVPKRFNPFAGGDSSWMETTASQGADIAILQDAMVRIAENTKRISDTLTQATRGQPHLFVVVEEE